MEQESYHDVHEPSTSQSNNAYDYLNKMFQPPRGTKFGARRRVVEANPAAENVKAEKSILTPGLRQEYERLQKQNLIPGDPFALGGKSGDFTEGSPVSEDSLSAHDRNNEDQEFDRGKGSRRSASKERRHRSRSKSGHHKPVHSKEHKRSKSRSRGGEGSSSRRSSRRSKSKSRDRRRSRDRHRSRSRDNSRNRSSNYRSHHDRSKRSPPSSKSNNWFNGKNFGSKNNRGANNSKRGNQKHWKNVPAKQQQQQQPQNIRRFTVIDKLEKLNMLDRFIETAKIYEEVIDPAEKAKLEGREKQSPIKPKTADDATISKTLESNLVCAKNLSNVTSQKRLVSLMSTMRFYLNQMNVDAQKYNLYFDSYLRKYCAWMGWDSISSEAALLVDLKDKIADPLKDFTYSMDEPFKCKSCSLVYPSSKFSCLTCSQLFTNLPDLFAHEFSVHGRLVQPTFSCFVCQQPFGADPVSFSQHYTYEHLCRNGHSECAVGCKTLIIGSSYLDLENHSAANHKCKICGDLLGDSLKDHLSFFHHTIAENDYLPEVFFEPVIDPDLAKLNDLLNTFEDVKKQNPFLFEDNQNYRNSQTSSSSVNNQSHSFVNDNAGEITEVNPIPNVHLYLTTKDAHAVTSLNVAGSEPVRKSFVETNDVDSFFSKYPDDVSRRNIPAQSRNCIYLDSTRDPRLKSEFYNWRVFFARLNRENVLGDGNEVSLEDRLFGSSSDLEPSRSHGPQSDLKVLNYVETTPLKRRNFDDLIEVGTPNIPVTLAIDPSVRNITHFSQSPITRKTKNFDYAFDMHSDIRVKKPRYTTHDDGVLDVDDSFDDVTDWDPKYDPIIRDFSDAESSRSCRDSLHDGFIVSNASTPRKNLELTRSHSTCSSPQKTLSRDPRLQMSSSRDSEPREKFGASSFRTNESWEPQRLRGPTEKERVAEAIALFLSKQ